MIEQEEVVKKIPNLCDVIKKCSLSQYFSIPGTDQKNITNLKN
jgi:hypothetical protein